MWSETCERAVAADTVCLYQSEMARGFISSQWGKIAGIIDWIELTVLTHSIRYLLNSPPVVPLVVLFYFIHLQWNDQNCWVLFENLYSSCDILNFMCVEGVFLALLLILFASIPQGRIHHRHWRGQVPLNNWKWPNCPPNIWYFLILLSITHRSVCC